MNTVRNVSFAALTAVVLSAGSACGMDAKSILNNVQGSPATAPLGLAFAGSVLKTAGYGEWGNRSAKAGIAGGLYAATAGKTGTYKGAVVAAATHLVLREALDYGLDTKVGKTVGEYLPEGATSDVAKNVACTAFAVAAGYKAEQFISQMLSTSQSSSK